MSNTSGNSISVIIPCHNTSQTLAACLVAISKAVDYAQSSAAVDKIEIIVIDDCSSDDSLKIAKGFSDNVLQHSKRQGANACRNTGIDASQNSILVFIDADIIIEKHHLALILDCFNRNTQIDAITGMLSAYAGVDGFCSHYKNIYMNYIFSKQHREVTFLYGSIYALRRSIAVDYRILKKLDPRRPAEDTRLGINLVAGNHKILILKELEVKHLKNYTLASLLINDFNIPYRWAIIFFAEGGWRFLGKNGSGFAHATRGQLLSLIIAPLATLVAALALFFGLSIITSTLALLLLWFSLNLKFFIFILSKRSAWFALRSLVLTFVDHHVMVAGVFVGLLSVLTRKYR